MQQQPSVEHGQERHHFHVPARELLLPTPEPCLFLTSLALEGLAVTAEGGHYLILSIKGDCFTNRMYLGPDEATVIRRSHITVNALRDGASRLDPDLADAVHVWIMLAWQSALDELVDALAAPALDQL